VNFIDTRDVADVARVALLEEFSPESQRAYHLTGTRAWTMLQVAEQLSSLLGHPVVYNHRSTEEQRATLLADGLPPLLFGGARCDRTADDGRADPDADRGPDTATPATAAATAAPASSTPALREGRRDASGNEGAGGGNHAERVHA